MGRTHCHHFPNKCLGILGIWFKFCLHPSFISRLETWDLEIMSIKMTTLPKSVIDCTLAFSHTICWNPSGQFWCAGYNSNGACGLGHSVEKVYNFTLSPYYNVTAVSAANEHSILIALNRRAYAFGENNNGQLGDGTAAERNIPILISTVGNVSAVYTMFRYSFVVDIDGKTWAFGYNVDGQLGLGDQIQRYFPTLVLGVIFPRQIAGYMFHTLIVKADGSLFGTGTNENGVLGLGTMKNTSKLVSIPITTSGSTAVVSIYTSQAYSIVKTQDGILWTFGYNNNGQLGIGDNVARTTPTKMPFSVQNPSLSFVGVGIHCTLLVNSSQLYNSGGCIGEVPLIPQPIWSLQGDLREIFGGVRSSVWQTKNSDIFAAGFSSLHIGVSPSPREGYDTYTPTRTHPVFHQPVIQIDPGVEHVLFRTSDNQVYSVGRNAPHGKLGFGDLVDRNFPTKIPFFIGMNVTDIACGFYHSLVVANRTAWSFGHNTAGQLGNGVDLAIRMSPIPIVGMSSVNISKVSAGELSTYMLTTNGTVYAVGNGIV